MNLFATLWKHLFPQPSPLCANTEIMQVAERAVLVASFGGIYDCGCAGHDAVAQMRRVVHQAFRQHQDLAGLVMDFSALEYTWGDDLLLPLDYHPDWDAERESMDHGRGTPLRPFPVVYVISDLNRTGLTSLITHEVFNVEPKDVLFDSVTAAATRLSHVFEDPSVSV